MKKKRIKIERERDKNENSARPIFINLQDWKIATLQVIELRIAIERLFIHVPLQVFL